MESLKLSTRRLKVTFKDANFLWGAWDNKTKSWNGVVGKVGTELKYQAGTKPSF
jgi:hypothetical protein